jgi:hypothetical protein
MRKLHSTETLYQLSYSLASFIYIPLAIPLAIPSPSPLLTVGGAVGGRKAVECCLFWQV